MRSIMVVTIVVLAAGVLGPGMVSCQETSLHENNPKQAPCKVAAQQVGGDKPEPDSNGQADDLAAYYGFGRMEMVKLEPEIRDLRIKDFNGDGLLDIVLANNRKARIEVLLQKESIGPAEVGVAVDPDDVDVNLLTGPSRFKTDSVAVSQRIHCLVCGDLNSDGLTDLAFYGEPKGLYVILQKATPDSDQQPKALGWRTRKKIDIQDGLMTPDSLICTDLNSDGRDDLALASREAVYMLFQKADGSVGEPVKYPTTSLVRQIASGDLNGDGLNDLVVVTTQQDRPVHVRFGLESGQLGPEVQFLMEKPYRLELANVDGAAGDEILAVDAMSWRLMCYKYSAERAEQADWPILFYPVPLEQENADRDLVAGDFDGDKLTDIVVSLPEAAELIFYKQVEGLGLAEPIRFGAFADITSLSAADVDADGKLDLAILSVKEKAIGLTTFEDERFSFPRPIELKGEPLAMELSDIEHDGRIDCVYISKDTNDVRFLRVLSYEQRKQADGGGAEVGPWLESGSPLELAKLSSNPEGIKVIDADQDGLEDVLIFIKYEAALLVHQSERGRFELADSAKARASLIKGASLSSIAVADIDGKAGKELLLAQNNYARSLVFAGGQAWNVVDQYNAKSAENRISAVAAFDIEGLDYHDRPAVLLLDGQKGRLQVLAAQEDMTHRFEKELDVGKWNAATHLKMLSGCFTGGGDRSILLFDSEKFAILTPPAAAKSGRALEQQFIYDTKIKDGAYGNLAAGDINSDERTDIVMVEYKRKHIEILALGPGYKPMPGMRFKVFEEKSYRTDQRGRGSFTTEPREMKIADVTGDGKEDLVTIIHDRIIVYPQD